MASEYSVNIRLNTPQVKKDLKTIGAEIANLGKKQDSSSKNALSATDKKLKLDQKILTFENRILTVGNSRLKTITKENKLSYAKSLLTRANNQALEGEFDLSKKNILKAIQQLKLLQKETLIKKGIQTQSTKKVKVEDTINKQLRERVRTLGQIVKLRNLGTAAGRLAGRFEFEEALNTRGPGGRMLALPSAEMLDQRVRGSGQAGGFSRNIPRFRLPRPTRGFDTQSALISGAFPLLFGQGPIGAVAGGLGGGIGGMFGQMGGFAGGIAATAVVQQIQGAVAAVAELGQAFNSVTPNIEALIGALGIAGTEEEKRLQLIQKQQGAQVALSQVTQKMNELIGQDGVKNLKEFGDNTRLLGNAFAEAMTKMRAALAPLLNLLAKPFTGQLSKKEQERLAGVGGAETDETLLELEQELGGIRSTKQNRARRSRIQARIADRKEELALFGQSIERANNLKLIENDITRKNRQRNELLQATIDGNREEVKLSQDINAEVQKRLDAGFSIIEIDIKDIENQIKKTNELEKQAAIAEQIEQSFKNMVGTIATDLSDGIKGLIRGTSTLNDVLNNVLNKMIDAAFNMAFFGNAGGTLTKGLGLFGNLFGGFLQSGGPARAGKSYIVGEKGPELFTPSVSGMVTPNSNMGGSTNIVVNVDASGSSVEGNEQDSRELGRLISVAVQSELVKQKRPGGILA